MKIKLNKGITKYQEKQCELFSNYSVSSSLSEYKKRNQLDKDKIISDIYNGKIAEFLVYNFLISKGKILNSPDLNIYSGYKKSFDADLVLDNVNIHVKSHIINGIFPVSWVFQRTDPLVKSPSDKDYLALVVLDDRGSYMYLKKTSQVLFKDPVKDVLKRTKVCVYETDIN
jgi:hypothetical protein